MILGVGVDVCKVARMRKAVVRPGFTRRVFSRSEVRYCARHARPEQHYAARFAAKEAYFKALGTGWSSRIGWTDVVVDRVEKRRPTLRVGGEAARMARSRGVTRAHLSLSHTDDHAVAVVVLEGRGNAIPRKAPRMTPRMARKRP